MIISNCVINLSVDKDKVLAEAFRVLKPGGRFAVSDIVFQGDVSLIPDKVMRDIEAWAGCVAGALEEQDYLDKLRRAGFADAAIEVTHGVRPRARGLLRRGHQRHPGGRARGQRVRARRQAGRLTRRGEDGGVMDRIVSIDHVAGSARDENVQGRAAASPARGGGALRARRPPAPLHTGAAGRRGLLPRRLSGTEPAAASGR